MSQNLREQLIYPLSLALFFFSMGVPLVRGLFPRGPKQPSTPPPTPAAEPIPKPSEPPWRKKKQGGFTRTSEPPTQRMAGSHDSRCYQNGKGCVCSCRNGSSCAAGSLFHPIGAALQPPIGAPASGPLFGTGTPSLPTAGLSSNGSGNYQTQDTPRKI